MNTRIVFWGLTGFVAFLLLGVAVVRAVSSGVSYAVRAVSSISVESALEKARTQVPLPPDLATSNCLATARNLLSWEKWILIAPSENLKALKSSCWPERNKGTTEV